MEPNAGYFCPVCKHLNEANVIVCSNCGTLLTIQNPVTTKQVPEGSIPLEIAAESIFMEALIPEEGIAIFLAEETRRLIAIEKEKEFILGRLTEQSKMSIEAILDLAPFGAFDSGVSRRHAIIRCTAPHVYEIEDLESSNGTWLNGKRIAPNKPYSLTNRAVIRVARINLQVFFRKSS